MKRTKYHKYAYAPLLFLMLAWIVYGCTDENMNQPAGRKNTELTFSVSLPPKPSTYALDEEKDEDNVGHIYVLAFAKSDGTYKLSDWSEGSSIQNNGSSSKKKFTLKFTRLQQGGSYTFALLANAEKEVNALFSNEGLTTGAEKNATLARLQLSGVTQWNTDPSDKGYRNIPMWGETAGDVTVNPDMTISDLKLLRMLARINVTVDSSKEPPATDHFVLESVSLYNPYPAGRIVPDANNLVSGSVSEVNKPTLVKDSKVVTGPVDYEVTDGATLIKTIYTFESAVPYQDGIALADQMTCLVIGGKYGGEDKTTYYRINLTDNNKKYLDILRNHTYGVNITKVKGSGYDNKEEAFKAKAVNMEAEIVNWNDGEVSEIIDNGQYILSIHPSGLINFSKDADSRTVQIKTDYPDGWKITRITEADGTTANSGWLSTNKNTGVLQGSDGSAVDLAVNVTENNTENDRTGYIYILFGRTITRLTVTQSIIAKLGITVRVGDNPDPVTELLFSAKEADSKKVVLEWFPQNEDLQITNSMVGSNEFTGSGIPQSGSIPGGNNGTGKMEYTITTKPFTDKEISENPFIEKSSKLDLMCSNGINYATVSVLVRQVNFNLIADKKQSYLLNSKQYTFYVRSNTNWRIKEISDPKNLLNIQGTDNLKVNFRGGGNIKQGTPIKFTTTTAPEKTSGDVTVTFESTNISSDIKVTLSFITAYYPTTHGGWAGSNIYWDTDLGRFAFEDTYVNGDNKAKEERQFYEGLLFKWGSLYGISRRMDANDALIIFTPQGKETTLGNMKWKWNDIPYIKDVVNNTAENRAYLYEITDGDTGLGDICKWMTEKGWAPAAGKKKWRMPTYAEIKNNGFSKQLNHASWTVITPFNAYGHGKIAIYATKTDNGIITSFPHGLQIESNGIRPTTPQNGYYFSSTPLAGGIAGTATLNINGGASFSGTSYNAGNTIRCVVDVQ